MSREMFVVAASGVQLTTVKDVPIVSTGTYQLAGNQYGHDTTFTSDDLADAVLATSDATVSLPRIKLGHDMEWADAEPAFGKVSNLRLGDNGQTIFGDLIDVPEWLAEIMPSAFPNRSMEGSFGVEAPSGKHYRMVITAVSLLGVQLPGVTSLDDLTSMYGATQPEGVVLKAKQKIAAALGRGHQIEAMALEDIKRQFYDQLDAEQQWWWVRAVYVDPHEMIVDDDAGGLFRIPFSVKGQTATFDTPKEVKITYVNASGEPIHASAAPALLHASRSESRPESNEQEEQMDPKEVRQLLGLPEDASDDAVREALKARAEAETPAPAEEPGETSEDQTDDESSEDESEESAETTEAVEEPVAAGAVTMDADEVKRLKAQAAAGEEARKQQIHEERERILDDAVKAGKFQPSRKDHWRKVFAADPQGTKETINTLEPGLVPVEELGGSPGDDELAAGQEAYPANWLPEIAARAEANNGNRVTQEVQ